MMLYRWYTYTWWLYVCVYTIVIHGHVFLSHLNVLSCCLCSLAKFNPNIPKITFRSIEASSENKECTKKDHRHIGDQQSTGNRVRIHSHLFLLLAGRLFNKPQQESASQSECYWCCLQTSRTWWLGCGSMESSFAWFEYGSSFFGFGIKFLEYIHACLYFSLIFIFLFFIWMVLSLSFSLFVCIIYTYVSFTQYAQHFQCESLS